jgi:hypothetical protein
MYLFLALTVMGFATLAADSGGGGSECFWADSTTESEDSSSSEKRLVCRVASLLNRPQALPQVRLEARVL